MMERSKKIVLDTAPMAERPSSDLELQLSGVIEQDGVTMATTDGIRRRARRTKRTRSGGKPSPSIFFDAEPPRAEDDVTDMDRATVDLIVKSVEDARERAIEVRTQAHPRSAYVLSLQNVMVSQPSTAPVERFSMTDALAHSGMPSRPLPRSDVYGTLTLDLMVDALDPHSFAEQFTPDDFFQAYSSVYGRMGNVIGAFRTVWSDFLGAFQRVERIEQRVADEVHDTLTIIEVPRLSFARSLAGFGALLLFVTLPAHAVMVYRAASDTKAAAVGAGNAGVQALLDAKDATSVSASMDSLQQASTHFQEANAVLNESGTLALGIAAVLPKTYQSARALLEVGDKVSESGRVLGMAFEKVFQGSDRRLDERFDVLAAYARGVLPLLDDASKAAATVDPKTLPAGQQKQFEALAERLDTGTKAVQEFAGLADTMALLVGKDRPRTYLFVFQNDTELRPTGGFMGSVAEVTMDQGKIANMVVPPGGPYDLKGQLLVHEVSPKPLQLINADWQFQDANWSPDFPTAAQKIRWFWSKAGQPTLDGVVAINASFVNRVLDVTGPIDMPEYGKVITSENFMLETQKAVELEYDKTANTPKKFVGDLAKALMERMKTLQQSDWMKIAGMVSEGLQTKEIQVALSNPDEEALAERFGWSGQMKDTDGDSLAIIETNLAGQKTDGVIAETVKHDVNIQTDGSMTDTVTLTRTHQGKKGELFRGVRNVSYVRVYTPKGSELLNADGFDTPPSSLFKTPGDDDVVDADIAQQETPTQIGMNSVSVTAEGKRTVFGGWAQLDPGATQTLTLTYKLPFTVKDIYGHLDASPSSAGATTRSAYTLLLTSQSGKESRQLTTTVTYPDAWATAWTHGADAGTGTLTYSGAWDRDHVVSALFSTSHAQ